MTARKLDNTIRWLKDCLSPSKFDVVVAAVKIVAGFDEKSHTYAVPSLPLKLGHSLHDCANITKVEAMKKNDTEALTSAGHFIDLYQIQWAKRVSTHASRTLKGRRMRKSVTLPLAEDLQKLQTFLQESAARTLAALTVTPDLKNWTLLSKITLAQLVLFNRRSGEAQRMTCDDYFHRSVASNKDLALGLSSFEQKLLSKFTSIGVVGKRGRPVPVLLTAVLLSQVELLMKTRDAVKIPESNVYVFAQSCSDMPLRSSDCLRNLSIEAGVSDPSSITSITYAGRFSWS